MRSYQRKDTRIKYYKNMVNMKLPASLNIGFSLSKGEYLTWTSDDNFFKKNAFELLFNTLKKLDENVGIVFAEHEIIDERGNIIEKIGIPESLDVIWWENIIGAAFMYTRKVYETVGDYDESKFLIEDYDYWLRIARKFTIYPIHESIYCARSHGGSLSSTRKIDVLKGKLILLRENCENKSLPNSVRGHICLQIAIECYYLDEYDEMIFFINRAKRLLGENVVFPKKIIRAMFLGKYLTWLYKKIRINL